MLGMGVLGGGGGMRRVGVRLDAEIAPYIAKLSQARAATSQFGREFGHVAAQGDQTTKMLGKAALVASGALVVGLGLAAHAAMNYESAFAGVRKTVDGTPEQLDAISDGVRGLAKVLPASATEIAAVAEEAGALGVQRGALLGFTETMINLGEATNLSAVEAAEGLARFSNVMGTPQDQVERLGSTLVDLGNKMAATEDEILEMGLRLAGAGQQVGLTETDVLAFAASLTSVGINAEAGGSAFSRVIADIASNVAGGTDKVAEFAEVAGMSADDFTTAWERDPAQALAAFVTGLDDMSEAGINTFGVLDQLGFGEIRVRDALLRSAGASDMLVESLATADTAWEENTALAAEAERRYETTGAKVQIAWNNLQDLGIGLGGEVLPIIARGTEVVTGFATGIAELPGPAKTAGIAFGGIATAAFGIVGVAGTLGPKLKQMQTWVQKLGETSPMLAQGLQYGGLAAGALGLAGLVAIPIIAHMGQEAADRAAQVDLFTQALIEAEGAADSLDVQREVASELANTDLGSALRDAEVDAQVFVEGIASGTDELDGFIDAMSHGPGMANIFVDGLRDGSETAGEFTDEIIALADAVGEEGLVQFGFDLKGLRDNFADAADAAQNYEYAQAGSNEEAALGADQYNLFAGEASGAADATDEMSEAQKRLAEGLETWSNPFSVYTDLLEDKRAKERESADSTQEMVDSITLTTGEWLQGLRDQEAAYNEWERNLFRIARRGHEDIAAEFASMGIESADQVAHFADLTDGQMRRVANMMRRQMSRGTDDAALELEIGLAIMARTGRHGTRNTVDAIAEEFGVSTEVVRGIANQYPGIILGGINPVLTGLGRPAIRANHGSVGVQGPGTATSNAFGGVYGGVGVDAPNRHVAEIAPAGAWRVWAEDETGGEAYIPLAQDRRGRSVSILADVARLFGFGLEQHAMGGFTSGADVPRPGDTRPAAGPWPGAAVNAANEHLYTEARKWVDANAHPHLGAGIGWEAMWDALHTQFPWASLISSVRPASDLTTSGNISYHSKGRAIDVDPSNEIFDWISANYKPQTLELIFTPRAAENIKNGEFHTYDSAVLAEHHSHVHWAMAHGGILGALTGAGRGIYSSVYDQGGWLPQGLSLAYNGTGMPERVVGPQHEPRGIAGPVQFTVQVNAPHYVGSVSDLSRAVVASLREPSVRSEFEQIADRAAGADTYGS